MGMRTIGLVAGHVTLRFLSLRGYRCGVCNVPLVLAQSYIL